MESHQGEIRKHVVETVNETREMQSSEIQQMEFAPPQPRPRIRCYGEHHQHHPTSMQITVYLKVGSCLLLYHARLP